MNDTENLPESLRRGRRIEIPKDDAYEEWEYYDNDLGLVRGRSIRKNKKADSDNNRGCLTSIVLFIAAFALLFFVFQP